MCPANGTSCLSHMDRSSGSKGLSPKHRCGHLSFDSSVWEFESWAAVIDGTSPPLSSYCFPQLEEPKAAASSVTSSFLLLSPGLLSTGPPSPEAYLLCLDFYSTSSLQRACGTLVINCFAVLNFLLPHFSGDYKLLQGVDRVTPP